MTKVETFKPAQVCPRLEDHIIGQALISGADISQIPTEAIECKLDCQDIKVQRRIAGVALPHIFDLNVCPATQIPVQPGSPIEL